MYFIILIAWLVMLNSITAQDEIRSRKELRREKRALPPEKGDIFIVGMPTIGYNPAFGFMYGAGATASIYFGDPKATGISSALAGISLTTKNQLIFTARSTIYTENNEWILNGDWRYLNSSLPTFGLGTGPASSKLASNGFEYEDNLFSKPIPGAQDMSYTLLRFYETVSKEVKSHLYLGLGYHLDIFKNIDDRLVDTSSVPPVITSNYAYNVKYGFNQYKNVLSGFSLNTSYDTRDNQNNSYKGQYANVSFHINPEFFGSNKKSTVLFLEYRKYYDLTNDHHNMLCFWGLGSFVISGTLPYMDLPALGEDQYGKSGRGYSQGRFRGQNLVYGEVEYRRHLLASKNNPDFLGMIVFANAVTASNKDAGTDLFKYINLAAGTGIRAMISKNARTNLGLDYGWGNYGSSGFYIKLNESF